MWVAALFLTIALVLTVSAVSKVFAVSTIVAVVRLRLLPSPPSPQVRWFSMPSLSHVAVAVAAAVFMRAVILVMSI